MSNKLVKCKTTSKYNEIKSSLSENDIVFVEDAKQIISNNVIYNLTSGSTGNTEQSIKTPKIIAGVVDSMNKLDYFDPLNDNQDVYIQTIVFINHDLTEYAIKKAIESGDMQEYDDPSVLKGADSGIETYDESKQYALILIPLTDEFKDYYGYTWSGNSIVPTDNYLGGYALTPVVRIDGIEYKVYGKYNVEGTISCDKITVTKVKAGLTNKTSYLKS